MFILSIYENLYPIRLWVILASLEARHHSSLTINSPSSQINQLQLPSEPNIHSVN